MKVMYRYNEWSYLGEPIVRVEVERETAKFVVTKDGRGRETRTMKAGEYFDTWEEAREFIITRRQASVDSYTRSLETAQQALAKAVAIPENEPR